MDYMYIDEIVEQLLNDTFSVFCGAGASADATNSQWESIFSKTTQDYYKNNYSDDIYFLADLERNYYNHDHFYDDVIEKIATSKDAHSAHIDAIIDLNINQVWTTNFDTIIEAAIFRKHGIKPTVIKESRDLFFQGLNSPYIIYKLNGSVSDRTSMVLTKTDFFDYFKKQRLLFELLKRQLVLDTFLFVGYSFKDDLVLSALREIKAVFPQEGKQHYRFVRRNSSNNSADPLKSQFDGYEQRYFEDKYNIKTIEIQSYSQIDLYLKELYKRFCNHNVFICGSFRNITYDQRLLIERIVGELISRLFKNGFNVYSGNGRGLGEIVVAQSKRYAGKMQRKLVNRPLIFMNESEKDKQEKNKLIIKDCSTMIIICGQDDTLGPSKNVWNQFRLFSGINRQNIAPLIIPIPITGYAAQEIFESQEFVRNNYFQLDREVFSKLKDCSDPVHISQIVVNLISSYMKEPNV